MENTMETTIIELYWGYIGLYWGYIGLYWGYIGLYWGYIGLYWGYMQDTGSEFPGCGDIVNSVDAGG